MVDAGNLSACMGIIEHMSAPPTPSPSPSAVPESTDSTTSSTSAGASVSMIQHEAMQKPLRNVCLEFAKRCVKLYQSLLLLNYEKGDFVYT
jgi:hypothetical protein